MSEEENLDDVNDLVADDWGDALAEQSASEDGFSPAAMEDFTGGGGDGDEISLDVVLDVPVTLSMEVGTTMITIRNLLQLTQGSVVELDRLAGETLDIKANGTLIAHGEVVVVNEKFGIRVLDVVTPEERIRKIKS